MNLKIKIQLSVLSLNATFKLFDKKCKLRVNPHRLPLILHSVAPPHGQRGVTATSTETGSQSRGYPCVEYKLFFIVFRIFLNTSWHNADHRLKVINKELMIRTFFKLPRKSISVVNIGQDFLPLK